MIRAGLALAIALSAGSAVAYRAGPPTGHTGAFGEPDCGACHFDAIRDDDAGSVDIRAPSSYEPGRTYEIVVKLRHPEVPAAGFQLTARFADGSDAGRQAGGLEPGKSRTRVETGDDDVIYASHSVAGVAPEASGLALWTLRWTAPTEGDAAAVAFDVVAQIANDDDSEFGERLYRARHIVRPLRLRRPGLIHAMDLPQLDGLPADLLGAEVEQLHEE